MMNEETRVESNDGKFPYIPMYRFWYEAIQEMEPSDQLATYNAMFDFAFNGVTDFYALPITARVFVIGIQGSIEKSIKRYYDGQRGGTEKGKDPIKDFGILGIDDDFLQFNSTENSQAFKDKYKTIKYSELSKTMKGKLKKFIQ